MNSSELRTTAMTEARHYYEEMHPVEKISSLIGRGVFYWIMWVIALAATVLAMLRTGPTFYYSTSDGNIIALLTVVTALIVIDMGAFSMAHYRIQRRHEHGHTIGNSMMTLNWTIAFVFVIQLFANLYSVAFTTQIGQQIQGTSELIMALLIGSSAPVVAFMSGHMISIEDVRYTERNAASISEYRDAIEIRKEGFKRWYNKKRETEWITIVSGQSSPVGFLQPTSPVQSSPVGLGLAQQSSPAQSRIGFQSGSRPTIQSRVFEYLDADPNRANMTGDEIAAALTTKRSSTFAAVKKWKSQRD